MKRRVLLEIDIKTEDWGDINVAEKDNYFIVILILLIIIGLFFFLVNIPKIFNIAKDITNVTQIKEYAIGLKNNNSLIGGVVDVYLYNESVVVDSKTLAKQVIKEYIFIESLKMENKSYTSKVLEMNKTYCFKGRTNGYYTLKFCKFLEISSLGEKIDINLNKSSHISIYSEEVIHEGEDSLIFNIVNNDSLEYRDINICLDWSNSFVYSRLDNSIEEINREGYYQHCYRLDKSLNQENKIIALRLYYKTTPLDSADFVEIYVFDSDEGYNKYNDLIVSEMNKLDIAGKNVVYKLTKYGNY